MTLLILFFFSGFFLNTRVFNSIGILLDSNAKPYPWQRSMYLFVTAAMIYYCGSSLCTKNLELEPFMTLYTICSIINQCYHFLQNEKMHLTKNFLNSILKAPEYS